MAYDAALDPDDLGLKGIMESRFQDCSGATVKPQAAKTEPNKVNHTTGTKAPSKPVRTHTIKVEDAPWWYEEQTVDWMDRLKACVKWVAVFGGLCILVFYWQQTGQMADSAAVPSMCACTAMAGLGIGKATKK